MIEQLIAEATECDFKVALETKKPKSWLKSVSAFSNGIGGTLFFGVSDDREPIGLSDVQKDAEAISRLIKERITPLPQFILERFCDTATEYRFSLSSNQVLFAIFSFLPV